MNRNQGRDFLGGAARGYSMRTLSDSWNIFHARCALTRVLHLVGERIQIKFLHLGLKETWRETQGSVS